MGQLHTQPVDLRAPNLYPPGNKSISHLRNRKIIFKLSLVGDMLVPWRVSTWGLDGFWLQSKFGLKSTLPESNQLFPTKNVPFWTLLADFPNQPSPQESPHFQQKKHKIIAQEPSTHLRSPRLSYPPIWDSQLPCTNWIQRLQLTS